MHTLHLSNSCISCVCVCVGFALGSARISVCMHMQHVKLDLTAESRAGNPTPTLQQKAFVATSPPLLLKPSIPGIKELLHSQAGLLTIRLFQCRVRASRGGGRQG